MVAAVARSCEDDTGRGSGSSSSLPELVVEPMMPTPESPLYYADHTPKVIAMRPMAVADIDQVRELHEEWFPIRYQQSFYDGAAQGVWRETGFPLFTRLAAEEAQPRISIVTTPTDESAAAAAGFELPPRPTIIYGAVMASTIPLTSIEDHGLLAADDYTHTHAMYILTLGSRAAVRRRGVASALLAECIEAARRQPQCGAVYLHVKADNISALRFYEKNGFRNVRFLEDYYVIDGVRHSAYLYIMYVNGAEPQSGWLELLTKPFFAFFSLASQGLKKLLEGMLEESANSQHAKSAGGRRRPSPASAPPLVDDMHVSHVPTPPSNAAVVSCV